MEDNGSKVGTSRCQKLLENKGEEGGIALAFTAHTKCHD